MKTLTEKEALIEMIHVVYKAEHGVRPSAWNFYEMSIVELKDFLDNI